MIARARDGETLDAICWRVLGRTSGIVEQVFALNPGLADMGVQIPGGTEVTLPELSAATPPVIDTVKLWDL